MNLFQIKVFLNEELKQQVLFDITPILNLGQSAGGYFGVTRQILCMIDFFGALYHGYHGDTYQDGRKRIQDTKHTIDFLEQFMGTKIYAGYKTNGNNLITMYRHGLVHLYQPKELIQNDGRLLSWFAYKGERENAVVRVGDRIFHNVKHLSIYNDPDDSNKMFLPISIDSLYYDLLTTIDMYTKELEQNSTILGNFISTANAITEPE